MDDKHMAFASIDGNLYGFISTPYGSMTCIRFKGSGEYPHSQPVIGLPGKKIEHHAYRLQGKE